VRIYARDIVRSLRIQAAGLAGVMVLCVVSDAWVPAVVLAFFAAHRWSRARQFLHVSDGYVDISPGIQVVQLRETRDRSREATSILRN